MGQGKNIDNDIGILGHKILQVKDHIKISGPQYFGQWQRSTIWTTRVEIYEELNIDHHFKSVGHAQTNGKVEATNKVVMDGLKKRVDALGGVWVDEIKNVLCSVRLTPKKYTGEIPFNFVYGSEAVTPIEIVLTSWPWNISRQQSIMTSNASIKI